MAASIPDRSLSEKVQIRLKRHGARNLFHVLFMRAVSAVVPFKILRGVYVNEPAASYLACSETYTAGLFTAQEMRRFAADPANEMPEAFIDSAAQKGDECYALIDGDNLAAYGWYARGPTSAGSPRLLLHFSDAYVYMYKGFTGNRYRGKRLHAIGMTRALREYRRLGFRGLVSYVESTNFDSLKSCDRMGYRVFGSIYLVKIFGRDFAFSSPGCKAFDFRVESVQ
jgi:hypothetical protein